MELVIQLWKSKNRNRIENPNIPNMWNICISRDIPKGIGGIYCCYLYLLYLWNPTQKFPLIHPDTPETTRSSRKIPLEPSAAAGSAAEPRRARPGLRRRDADAARGGVRRLRGRPVGAGDG